MPLSKPIWSALTGARQSPLAIVDGGARRFRPEYAMFASTADRSDESLMALSRLVQAGGDAALVEETAPPAIDGTQVVSSAGIAQMVAGTLTEGPPPAFGTLVLGDADAAEMLALALLTRPGPFFERTHQLGRFIGVRDGNGVLVAMAGERMAPDGFTEVSGVCTHPDHRGKGYGAALTRLVAARIFARGETPFLHAYAAHTGTIGLYETLGFRVSRELVMTVLGKG